MSLQVVTANRLRDGRVIYLDAADGWSTDVAAARLCEDEAAATAALAIAAAAVAARRVVEPYLIAVERADGAVSPTRYRPVRYREVIRAFGPSIAAGTAAKET